MLHNSNIPITIFKAADAALIMISALISRKLTIDFESTSFDYINLWIVSSSSLVFVIGTEEVYRSWRLDRLHVIIKKIAARWCMSVILGVAVATLIDGQRIIYKPWFFLWALLGLLNIIIFRVVVYKYIRHLRRKKINNKKICTVMTESEHVSILEKIRENAWSGYVLENNFVCFDESAVAYCNENCVEEIWVSARGIENTEAKDFWDRVELTALSVKLVPNYPMNFINYEKTEFLSGIPLVEFRIGVSSVTDRFVKRMLDLIVTLVSLVVFLPVFIIVPILIKIESSGPVIFKQKRLGKNGKIIEVYKFRSMSVSCEKISSQVSRNDPRVTRVGRILRKTSIDELPQLINVLNGDMSIVGPRPHPLTLNDKYVPLLQKYMRRHLVLPGITGLAQINGFRGETDTIYKMEKRLEFDLYYIENWSIWLDLQIIIMTLFKGFVSKNAF